MKKERGMTLVKDDCLNFLRGFQDSSIRLIIADPPYNIGFTGSTSNTSWDQGSEAEFSQFTVDWLSEAKRVLTDDGSIWMFCDRTKIPALFKDIETVGLVNDLENWAIWCRAKGRASTKRLPLIHFLGTPPRSHGIGGGPRVIPQGFTRWRLRTDIPKRSPFHHNNEF